MHDILLGCLAATVLTAIMTIWLYIRTKQAPKHRSVWFFTTLLSGVFCFFCASSSALIFVASLP